MMPEDFKQEKVEGQVGCRAEVVVRNNLQKREVKLPGIKAKIVIKVKDKDGNIVSQKELPANSFVLNFMKMLYAVFRVTSVGTKDVNGNDTTMRLTIIRETRTYEVEYHTTTRTVELAGFQAWAIKEDDSHGIQIGTGTTPVSPDDYALTSKVPNGIGEGKMLYLDCNVSSTLVTGNTAHIEIKRSFLNYSGSTITVTEIGLVVKQFSPETCFLIIRDLIEATDVPNNYGMDVSYIIEVSV